MSEIRLGRQTPTVSVVLPYKDSRGSEAIEIYNKSGRTALQWQELMIEDIMAVDENGLWVHMKFAWSIPRRNGKSEDLIIRAIWGVIHGERILYTAHRTSTSHNAWEKICSLLSKIGYVEGEDYKTSKRYGMETIIWLDGSGGEIHFRTRTSNGGLGEGFDLLIIDEAQEYTSDQESALKYLVTDSQNPQTLMCGTPPTAVSSGDVFERLRKNVFNGKEEFAGWAEWSVPRLSDAHNPDLWYETNPSLGTILTETLKSRHKKLPFYGVSKTVEGVTTTTFYRMTGFTSLPQNKNPQEYSRQYVDEDFQRSDIMGYAPQIPYNFDRHDGNKGFMLILSILPTTKKSVLMLSAL